jgi:hypothetical protein
MCLVMQVVFCLVELQVLLGDLLQPHLLGLSTAQQKLLDIYVARVRDKRTHV